MYLYNFSTFHEDPYIYLYMVIAILTMNLKLLLKYFLLFMYGLESLINVGI